jgi:hypothetical protein
MVLLSRLSVHPVRQHAVVGGLTVDLRIVSAPTRSSR